MTGKGNLRSNNSSNKELRTIGILSSIGHRKKTRASVLKLKVLIGELLSIDRLSTGTITTSEVTSLNHEVVDNTVELRAFVAETLLSGCESTVKERLGLAICPLSTMINPILRPTEPAIASCAADREGGVVNRKFSAVLGTVFP
jgi:hypothetical protein